MTKEVMDILSPTLGEDLAKDIIAHRKGLKCPLTARGARALLKQYELTGNPVAAAEYQLNMGWRGFSHEWVNKKGSGFHDPHNPMPRQQSREEYIRDAIRRNNDDWEGSSDRRVNNLIKLAVAK
ncbi:hypothetical protein [Rhizobium lentis]|uniref:Uncharacterized protein n=1 Tax=Rhizobium lentis TaxID=1138194 RepID=A0ABS7IGA9_9HYPH|nr:hypothetical protein [Rhizobium lentis]MBX5089371.1 hypothetical protein [Rhizobium lentis]